LDFGFKQWHLFKFEMDRNKNQPITPIFQVINIWFINWCLRLNNHIFMDGNFLTTLRSKLFDNFCLGLISLIPFVCRGATRFQRSYLLFSPQLDQFLCFAIPLSQQILLSQRHKWKISVLKYGTHAKMYP